MEKYNQIKGIIKETGLSFNEESNVFSSYWKIDSEHTIKIIIAYDIHPEWVHILCNIGLFSSYKPEVARALLRLNNAVIGVKFSLGQNNAIVCSSEIRDKDLTEDYMKKQITQVVKIVTNFYDLVKKENLKLNSA